MSIELWMSATGSSRILTFWRHPLWMHSSLGTCSWETPLTSSFCQWTCWQGLSGCGMKRCNDIFLYARSRETIVHLESALTKKPNSSGYCTTRYHISRISFGSRLVHKVWSIADVFLRRFFLQGSVLGQVKAPSFAPTAEVLAGRATYGYIDYIVETSGVRSVIFSHVFKYLYILACISKVASLRCIKMSCGNIL